MRAAMSHFIMSHSIARHIPQLSGTSRAVCSLFSAVAVSALLLSGCVSTQKTTSQPNPQISTSTDEGAAPGGLGVLQPLDQAQGLDADPTQIPVEITGEKEGIIPEIPSQPAAKPLIKVGLLLPLSGRDAGLGGDLKDAALLAISNLADDSFELVIEDTAGQPHLAQQAAQRALSKGAKLILGPLYSSSVQAVAPIVRQAGVNMVSFTTVSSSAGGGVFVMGFLPGQDVARVVQHARSKNLRSFSILAPQTAYGQVVANSFKREVLSSGGVVVDGGMRFYDPRTQDFAPVIRTATDFDRRKAQLALDKQKLARSGDQEGLKRLEGRQASANMPYDAMLIVASRPQLMAIAPLLRYYDVQKESVQLLGTGLWDDAEVRRDPNLVGGWYPGPDPQQYQQFIELFKGLFGRTPKRLASLAYDATALAIVLNQQHGARGFQTAYLMSNSGFAGVDGVFRFTQQGIIDRQLAVLEITRKGPIVVSPAAQNFNQLRH